ncbi:MAG: prepilin-type N-terminal cleavage/methylation domain-containing protein [Candidatus Pacebacteria bacterium]|nr:prepilin-type N-terminal cleavage/methylation domain-containing protein [Candidatus Paceibacterota bacterium]
MNKRISGFTILELLVVVAIIGIMTSIALFMLTDAREKGRDSRRFDDLAQIKNALELYSSDNNALYPAGSSLDSVVNGGYLKKLPVDPLNTGVYTYMYQATDFSGTACNSNACTSYVLKGVLEQTEQEALVSDVDGVIGGLDCADPALCITP